MRRQVTIREKAGSEVVVLRRVGVGGGAPASSVRVFGQRSRVAAAVLGEGQKVRITGR